MADPSGAHPGRSPAGPWPLIAADAAASVFSVKCFVAAMIAYFIVLKIGFLQPVWAVITVYLISQPLAAAVLSKALFRLLGTCLGGAAAVVFLPEFVNQPLMLSFVLSVWLGACVYLAQVDRTPRSYVFLLSGYTAGIIGLPNVQTPDQIFNVAVLRVQEISIGIVVASLVHGLILPVSLTSSLRDRVRRSVSDCEAWSRRGLAGSRDPHLDRDRRRLAADINDIEQLSFHLSFDKVRLIPLGQAIRAAQDQISWLLPIGGVVEDRIAECREQPGGVPIDVRTLITNVESWLRDDTSPDGGGVAAADLFAKAQRLAEAETPAGPWTWRDMLLASLLARLADLVVAHGRLRELRDHIMTGRVQSLSTPTQVLIAAAAGRSMHRDHVLALRTALGACVATNVICWFWIGTAWPNGATAALITSVACSLFASAPVPHVAVLRFLYGSMVGILIAAAYGYFIFPRVTDFPVLALVMAPTLILIGAWLARPTLALLALGALIGLLNTVGLSNAYTDNFVGFANGSLAQFAGTVVAAIFVRLFQTFGAKTVITRLFRAGFRDIAARAEGRARNTQKWISRMMDRTALIAARAETASTGTELVPYDSLVGLRTGYTAGELHLLLTRTHAGSMQDALAECPQVISVYFRNGAKDSADRARNRILGKIDHALEECAVLPSPALQRDAIISLTGLRRSLFPDSHGFARGSQ